MASERLRQYGHVVVAGDLVLPPESEHVEVKRKRADCQPRAEGGAEGEDSEGADAEAEGEGDEDKFVPYWARVLLVDDDTKDNYCIFDVVLPLPGSHVRFPEHTIGGLMRSYLAHDGTAGAHTIERGTSNLPGVDPNYTLCGAYRRLLQRPRDLEYEHISRSELEERTRSGWLARQQNPYNMEEPPRLPASRAQAPTDADTDDGGAVLTRFSLERGTYATMMLRELTEDATSSGRAPRHVRFEDEGGASRGFKPLADAVCPAVALASQHTAVRAALQLVVRVTRCSCVGRDHGVSQLSDSQFHGSAVWKSPKRVRLIYAWSCHTAG